MHSPQPGTRTRTRLDGRPGASSDASTGTRPGKGAGTRPVMKSDPRSGTRPATWLATKSDTRQRPGLGPRPYRRSRTVVFTGGGTGGHLYPAIAIADELRALRPEVEVVFIGARRGIEARILPERGESHLLLGVQPIDRSRPHRAVGALWALARATLAAAECFHMIRPQAVVATGGFASTPAGLAAAWLRMPLVIQEQNAFPGLVLRWLSRWANAIHVAFPDAVRHLSPRSRSMACLSGNPVRLPDDQARRTVRKRLCLGKRSFLVVVTGGSQGAAALNDAVIAWARAARSGALAVPKEVFVLWSFGRGHEDSVASQMAALDQGWLKPVPYIEDLPGTFAAADLAVGRAGAMTTAEICNAGLPSVLVPLPSAADDHQTANARALAAAGAAIVLREDQLNATSLAEAIANLARDGDVHDRMALAAQARARPRAAQTIAGSIAELLDSHPEASR